MSPSVAGTVPPTPPVVFGERAGRGERALAADDRQRDLARLGVERHRDVVGLPVDETRLVFVPPTMIPIW